MKSINLKLSEVPLTTKISYYQNVPGVVLKSPRAFYYFMKFVVRHFYDKIPALRRIRIDSNTPLCEVDIEKILKIVNNYLEKNYKEITIAFPTDENIHGSALCITQEKPNTVYIMGVSFLPLLSLHYKKEENLIIAIIQVLRRYGMSCFENNFHNMEGFIDNMEDHFNYDDPDKNLKAIFKEEKGLMKYFSKYYHKVVVRADKEMCHKNLEQIITRYKKAKTTFPFKKELIKIAEKVQQLKGSMTLDEIEVISREDFNREYDITEDSEYVPSFNDLFLISWINTELMGEEFCQYISDYSNNYGYIEGIIKIDLKKNQKIDKILDRLKEQGKIGYLLPDIMGDLADIETEIRKFLKLTRNGQQSYLPIYYKTLRKRNPLKKFVE